MQHQLSFDTLYSYYLVGAKQLTWVNDEYHNNTQRCGPLEYNGGMLGAQYEYEFPCTNLWTFHCYISRAQKTIIEYWVMISMWATINQLFIASIYTTMKLNQVGSISYEPWI